MIELLPSFFLLENVSSFYHPGSHASFALTDQLSHADFHVFLSHRTAASFWGEVRLQV